MSKIADYRGLCSVIPSTIASERNFMAYSCYITFPTTFFAIRAESLLKKEAYTFKMVPVPRSISSSCGTALRCDCSDIDPIRSYLIENELELESFYRLEEIGYKVPTVEELHYND